MALDRKVDVFLFAFDTGELSITDERRGNPGGALPAKGSRMEAPGAVDARMTRLKSSTGF